MKRMLTALVAALIAALAGIVGLATSAAAVTAPIGNPATDRGASDTWQDFTLVDTNHPAAFDGYFTSITYYAEVAGRTVRFVVVDGSGEVTWVSDEVTASSTGPQTVNLGAPVGVTTGSNLGVYSKGYGAVSFDYDTTAQPAYFDVFFSGVPAVGETIDTVGSDPRVYSMNASVTASSPAICKNGGWETYGYPNQGQCIASIVANARAGK